MNIYNIGDRQKEIGAAVTECNNALTNRVLDNCSLNGAAREILKSIMFDDDFMWEKIGNKLIRNKKGFPVNTYPFGEATYTIYPQWIGIYREEENVAGQNKLIEAASNYIENANKDGILFKDIVIITDAVNKKFLDKLEKAFLCEYRKGHLRVYIFYVNDYGITYIPFIYSFDCFEYDDDVSHAISNDVNIKKITNGYDYASARYTSHWNAEGLNYELIVDKNTITKVKIHPYGTIDSEEVRKLSVSDKNRFVIRIDKLMKRYPEADKVLAYDEGTFEADLFGHLYYGSGICEFYMALEEIFYEAYESATII